MKKGNYVRLVKMIAGPNDSTGEDRGLSAKPKPTVRQDYWVEGYLAEDIALSGQITFEKHLRNGLEVCGSFRTSPIVAVRGNDVWTQMSCFRVLRVPPFDPDKSLQAWEQ